MATRGGEPADSVVGKDVRGYFDGHGWFNGKVVGMRDNDGHPLFAIDWGDGDQVWRYSPLYFRLYPPPTRAVLLLVPHSPSWTPRSCSRL